eukprot:gene42071-52153_t
MFRTLFIGLFAATGIAAHAQYSSPESVEYDQVGNRYIVSSTNNGNLLAVQPGQAPTLFTADVSAPYGLAEYNGVIYVCDDGFVKGYTLSNGQPAFSLNLGGTFLNGICSDGIGHLFVTDFSAKKIYRVNIAAQTFGLVANTVNTPNGILFDEAHARLIYCTWGASAKLVEMDTVNYTMTPKITTTLSNFDGVVQDGCGNFLVSEWGSNKIYKIDSTFGAPVAVFSSGINKPADIYFNLLNDTLAVPNTAANTVTFYDADFCTEDTVDNTSITEEAAFLLDVISLPGELRLRWKLPNTDNAPMNVQVHDLTGRLLQTAHLSGTALVENTYAISTQNWAAGIYVVQVSAGGRTVSKKVYVGRP